MNENKPKLEITKAILNAKNNEINMKQPLENDLKALETGAHLEKMHVERKKFQKRFYKLDLKNNRLIASTRQLGKKEKICN